MSKRQLLVMAIGGLVFSALGWVSIALACGWAATGISLSHAGTPVGVLSSLCALGGLIVSLVGVATALMQSLTRRI
jgi:hypothetical protein